MSSTRVGSGLVLAAASVALLLGALLPAAPARATTLPGGFADSLVIDGLDLPVGFAFLPDRRVLVVEQKSAKVRLAIGNALAPSDPVATLPDVETSGAEQGLLGIAVDPGWPARPYVYIHTDDPTGVIRISRYTVTGDLAFTANGALAIDPASRYDLVADIPDAAPNHNGGTLRFGNDGMLYDSAGDDASFCPAQDNTTLLGKILRLDVSRLPPGTGRAPRALVAPAGNPFASSPDSNARLVWAMGLRNPFRFGIDAGDGSLFVADVGNNLYEEVDHVTAGGMNFGWPLREGPVAGPVSCGTSGTDPIYAYDDGPTAAAIIGGPAYRRPSGAALGLPSDYDGDVFFSDYYYGFLRRLKLSGGVWALAPPDTSQPSALNWGVGFDAVSDWQVGPDGALWYCRQAIGFTPSSGQIRSIFASTLTNTIPRDSVGRIAFRAPEPNPSKGDVTFRWELPQPATVHLFVFDATGRRVRGFVLPPGAPNRVFWNRADDHGRPVRPGIYVARLEVAGATQEHRFALIR